MHCFINLPKGPLLSIPNPNNLPRDGHGRTSYLSSLLPGALCNICCILPFLVVPRIFLLFMFILCSLHPPNNVSFAFDKKDHGGWKFATLLSLDNERGVSQVGQQDVFFSLFPNFSNLPQVYFRFSWLLKRLKRSGIGAWAGACSQTAWTAAGRHGQGMILYRVSQKYGTYSSILTISFIWNFTGLYD